MAVSLAVTVKELLKDNIPVYATENKKECVFKLGNSKAIVSLTFPFHSSDDLLVHAIVHPNSITAIRFF